MSLTASEEDALDTRLSAVMEAHGASLCRHCGRALDRGDLAWNGGQTEAGTQWSVVEIICQACSQEAARVSSWYAPCDDLDEAIGILERDWEFAWQPAGSRGLGVSHG
jgi:hypothetical protein